MFIGSGPRITASSGSGPALNLDLRLAALDGRLTFARASAATDIINGVMTSFATDAARISTTNGLLMEESRTNTVQNGSGWNFANCVGTSGATDLMGGTTAYSVTANAGTFKVTDEPSTTGTWTVSSVYTTTRFVKPGTATRFQMLCGAGVSSAYVNFLLTGSGSVTSSGGSPLSTLVQNVGGGWYRIGMTFTAGGTSGNCCSIYPISSGSETRAQTVTYAGTETYTTCFGQVELGVFATSYIPTTTSNATRAVENCTMTVGSWFNTSEGTLFAEALAGTGFDTAAASSSRLLRLENGGNTGFHELRRQNSDSTFRTCTTTSGTGQSAINVGTWPGFALQRVAYGYRSNDMAGAVAGGNAATDTTSPDGMPSGISLMRIGSTYNAGSFNGYVRLVRYWRQRLSNEQLKAMTS